MISGGLLIHRATVQAVTGYDEDRNEELSGAFDIKNVRFTAVRQTVLNAHGLAKDDKLTMYFDCVASEPTFYAPAEGDRITWEGKTYTVRAVTPCYGHGGLHHYKAALV